MVVHDRVFHETLGEGLLEGGTSGSYYAWFPGKGSIKLEKLIPIIDRGNILWKSSHEAVIPSEGDSVSLIGCADPDTSADSVWELLRSIADGVIPAGINEAVLISEYVRSGQLRQLHQSIFRELKALAVANRDIDDYGRWRSTRGNPDYGYWISAHQKFQADVGKLKDLLTIEKILPDRLLAGMQMELSNLSAAGNAQDVLNYIQLLDSVRDYIADVGAMVSRHLEYMAGTGRVVFLKDLFATPGCAWAKWIEPRVMNELVTEAATTEDVVLRFVDTYRSGTLAQLDSLFTSLGNKELTVQDFVELKLPKVIKMISDLGMTLDPEQIRANARPETRLQIKARAGSGKTRTLTARAALAIRDESLDPNQVLILAFNRSAAAEVRQRVQKLLRGDAYANARTFHSLAYQLVKPKKKLLFNGGGNPSAMEQSRFAQRIMQRIMNPTFKEEIVAFFRKELEQIESIGRDLPPADYYMFRRSLEHVTLGGQWVRESGEHVFTNGERVKSRGEKFIADFFFEHDIKYRYERAWDWKTPFLDGATYKPDFSILANGKDYILEHWAIDPEDPDAELPGDWRLTAHEYKVQIQNKRLFWKSKNILLIETHAGMIRTGRESFERQLSDILTGAGIQCLRLSSLEIVERVFKNEFLISRMAELFLQFVQRAKKRGWSVDAVANVIELSPDKEPRARSFHQLALRAYREYELMLREEEAMDFDDLLVQATESVNAMRGAASIHLGNGDMIPLRDLRWILLDEFQDFSELYFRMLSQILESVPEARLVAVGDDWQAINSFAGAELRFFDEFSAYFPGSATVGVTTNYRSDRVIVSAGNGLMRGRGGSARVSDVASAGDIRIIPLSSMRIQFVRSAGHENQWAADQVYLPAGTDGKTSEASLRQALALKACVDIISAALTASTFETLNQVDAHPTVMLVSRTNIAYGLTLENFKSRLVDILEMTSKARKNQLTRFIDVVTVHGSKGREANTVIILDATDRQFPKIHSDNLLFQLLGVTPLKVLDEERRLFYVAITRARHQLCVLTEKGIESPYLEILGRHGDPIREQNCAESEGQIPVGRLALAIKSKIASLNLATESKP